MLLIFRCGIYHHFSRSYLLPAAVFTAALVRITSGGIYRLFSRVMISAAVFTAAIDLAFLKCTLK